MRIGLSGKFCSGKDTIAKELGLPRYAFADGMKDEVAAVLTLHGVSIDKDYINANKAKFRSMLQVYGTDFIRQHLDDAYWVNRLLRNITTDDAVVTDVRFPNEADALKAAGFAVIRLDVVAPIQRMRYRALHGSDPTDMQINHPSETALDDYPFSYYVDANKPLDKVMEAVYNLPLGRGTLRQAMCR